MSEETAKLNLTEVRGRIDAIDTEIQKLIAERALFARQVGQAKGPMKAAVDYYRPEREAQVLRMVIERNLAHELDSKIELAFLAGGLRCKIPFPPGQLAAIR